MLFATTHNLEYAFVHAPLIRMIPDLDRHTFVTESEVDHSRAERRANATDLAQLVLSSRPMAGPRSCQR